MMTDIATYENEAAVTRKRIAMTIDDLQARLSPKALVDSAVESFTTTCAQALASVRGTTMAHPLAIAAAGLAIGIALLARSKVRGATVEYGDSYAAYADHDDCYAANLAVDDVPVGPARARIDALQHRAQVAVGDNPLTVVVVGLATGVLIGAVVPVSDAEHAMFDDVGARLEAAGGAAIDAARGELDFAKFSFAGGTAGIAARATGSLLTVVSAAGAALLRTPKGFTPHSAA